MKGKAPDSAALRALSALAKVLSGDDGELSFRIPGEPWYAPHERIMSLPACPDPNMQPSELKSTRAFLAHEAGERGLNTLNPADRRWKDKPGLKDLVNAVGDVRIDAIQGEKYIGVKHNLTHTLYADAEGFRKGTIQRGLRRPSYQVYALLCRYVGSRVMTHSQARQYLTPEAAVLWDAIKPWVDRIDYTKLGDGSDNVAECNAYAETCIGMHRVIEQVLTDVQQAQGATLTLQIVGPGEGNQEGQGGGEAGEDKGDQVVLATAGGGAESGAGQNITVKIDKATKDRLMESTNTGGDKLWDDDVAARKIRQNQVEDLQGDSFTRQVKNELTEFESNGSRRYTFIDSYDTTFTPDGGWADPAYYGGTRRTIYQGWPRRAQILQHNLVRSLAVEIPKHRRFLTKGEVDERDLDRLILGEENVLRRRIKQIDKDTAIVLSIDMSSSMNGVKAHMTCALALIWSRACRGAGIPLMIYGWQTWDELPSDIRSSVYRTSRMRYHIFQGFNTPWRRNEGAIPQIPGCCGGMTPLGEGLEYGLKAVAKRPERRKIVFCLTDGHPEMLSTGPKDVHHGYIDGAIKRAHRSHIEVVGIGILTDCSRWFPHSVVLTRLEQFEQKICKELLHQLRLGRMIQYKQATENGAIKDA